MNARPHLRLVRPVPTRGERRARTRQRLQSAAGICLIVVLAGFAAGMTWAVASALLGGR
jgi:hypothetical protein